MESHVFPLLFFNSAIHSNYLLFNSLVKSFRVRGMKLIAGYAGGKIFFHLEEKRKAIESKKIEY